MVVMRDATLDDLSAVVAMLADDDLGSGREVASAEISPAYTAAFHKITSDSNHRLIIAELNGDIVGTFHLIYIPSLSYTGRTRAQIESVRTVNHLRGQGIGKQMMAWAIEEARNAGCNLVQLSTNNYRKRAHRFYEKLGFKASHQGMKLIL
ncbi:MAG: GNAT family N-acetyltransferase [Candidatus Promineifilaceae bacterium]